MLHKICPVVIEKAEQETSASSKKEKSIIYWNMNYKGKFRRTLWFIPIVVISYFTTPLFMGRGWVHIRCNPCCDFNFPQEEIEDIKKEIESYFTKQNIRCIFNPGNRIKE